jgi:hypothetical protein
MRQLLTLIAPCLLLVCCEKPVSSDNGQHETSTATQTRRRHAPREQAPDRETSLRTQIETALAIESLVERDKALADVAWSAMETNPELAHEAFHRLPADSPEKIRLIQHYAMRLAERNREEALEWADSLETELETSAAIGQIALSIAETDPLRAANLLSDSGIAGRDFDVAVVQVIQRWAANSPPDAAKWVSTFPPGEARQAGIKFIAERWLPGDAPASFQWYDSLKDPELRKESARAMEGILLQQTQEIREAWLQHADTRIQSELEQQREQAIKDVGDNIPPAAK